MVAVNLIVDERGPRPAIVSAERVPPIDVDQALALVE